MSPLIQRWTAALDQLRALDRHRAFGLPAGLDFTSNDYLGYGGGRLPVSPSGPELARSGMASRLLRGHHAVWDDVESALAAWHGSETALMMTSGYAANEGLLSTICEPGDWVAYDELSHACIADGLRLAKCRRHSFRHNDLQHLEDGLKAEVGRDDPGRARFVVTESVFSMDGDRAPLREIAALADRFGASLIVDEAHGTGCHGPAGSGCVDEAGVRDRVLASVHTGGKALALPGAYIAGSKLLKEYLTNRCRHLIFTTALPAECGRWWLQRLPIVRGDDAGRSALHVNNRRLREALAGTGAAVIGTEYVVPVVLGDDGPAVRVAAAVRAAGFDVRAIRPPTVAPGTSRVRVSVHADHAPETLDALAAAFRAALAAGA